MLGLLLRPRVEPRPNKTSVFEALRPIASVSESGDFIASITEAIGRRIRRFQNQEISESGDFVASIERHRKVPCKGIQFMWSENAG